MSELNDVIQKIKENPKTYLGKRSLVALKAFLAGYSFAKREPGCEITELELELEKFQRWVQGLGKLNTDKSWERIIMLHSEDDIKALEKFFVLYEGFCLDKSKESSSQI